NGLSRSDNMDIEIRDNEETATLDRIVIRGPGNVNENASATYTCRAFFSDGSDRDVAARSWRVNCPEAGISNDGVLTADEVQADSECTLTARFSSGGISTSAQKNIHIRDNTVTAALRRIEVRGPNRVNENSTTRYTCRAFYSDGSQRNVKPDWSIKTGASFGRIDGRGNLKTHKVDANAKIVILASYSDVESIRSDKHWITVNNKGASTPSPKQIIIDNGAAGTSHKGRWRRYSNKQYREKKNPPHERDSVYSRGNGDTYTFRRNIDGIYMVSLRWIGKWGQSDKVPVKIYNGKTLIDIVHVDQKTRRDRWVALGTYRFNNGFARVVVISGKPATSVDGVRFLKKTHVLPSDQEFPWILFNHLFNEIS
ncbi:MAG: hypothetical protein U9Q05_07020, partial [Thermodesulfobacteriota bacterium]|nr:hypothetical protein [Thermodesulfobacteriota bacterium]